MFVGNESCDENPISRIDKLCGIRDDAAKVKRLLLENTVGLIGMMSTDIAEIIGIIQWIKENENIVALKSVPSSDKFVVVNALVDQQPDVKEPCILIDDRVAVMQDGRISGYLHRDDYILFPGTGMIDDYTKQEILDLRLVLFELGDYIGSLFSFVDELCDRQQYDLDMAQKGVFCDMPVYDGQVSDDGSCGDNVGHVDGPDGRHGRDIRFVQVDGAVIMSFDKAYMNGFQNVNSLWTEVSFSYRDDDSKRVSISLETKDFVVTDGLVSVTIPDGKTFAVYTPSGCNFMNAEQIESFCMEYLV